MEKRKIIFGTYDTATYGWTLAGWQLSAAEQKTNYVEKIGGDGSWDLSTALTDGTPRYRDRTLTVTLECSEGDRNSREIKIRHMINLLDGMQMDIKLPDDPDHHLTGRVHVARNYSNLAHTSVTVTATTSPWKYADAETVVTVTHGTETSNRSVQLTNDGRLAVVPMITVSGGADAGFRLKFGGANESEGYIYLAAGTYKLPNVIVPPGGLEQHYNGQGTLTFTYREAVLE